jgi:hypothetical protein
MSENIENAGKMLCGTDFYMLISMPLHLKENWEILRISIVRAPFDRSLVLW